ncbi:PilW family protein [Variovorax robiniae]|uniref:PilW family protein n=1 Tax=Variovorax robiniae TaxID=1836199 RepID=A0ABU8X531_9BURK
MRSRHILRAVQQAGFTLVELMVAIAIALFLLAAVLNVYLNMKNTFNAQDDLAQLQDSQRLALTMLTTTIQSAGYFVDPLNTLRNVVFDDPPTVTRADGSSYTFAKEQVITGTTGTGTGAASDSVTVRYQRASGDGLMNCQGGTYSGGTSAVTVNTFRLNANNELTCTLDDGTGANAPVALATNVSGFSVRYGVDTNDDGTLDTYMPASGIEAASPKLWGRVYTARVTLQFARRNADGSAGTATVVQVINLMNKK